MLVNQSERVKTLSLRVYLIHNILLRKLIEFLVKLDRYYLTFSKSLMKTVNIWSSFVQQKETHLAIMCVIFIARGINADKPGKH